MERHRVVDRATDATCAQAFGHRVPALRNTDHELVVGVPLMPTGWHEATVEQTSRLQATEVPARVNAASLRETIKPREAGSKRSGLQRKKPAE